MMNPNVRRHDDEGLGWTEKDGLYSRNYEDYAAYLIKQVSKLDNRPGWCKKLSIELRQRLQSSLKELRIVKHVMAVLCLGARLGGEVEAFIKMGAFAIGIDLNPGVSNQYVLHGDFHELQFADNSIDLVYTNCFDHCLEPERVLAEIHRVLKPDGLLQMDCKAGSNETKGKSMGSDHWDCLEWESLSHLAKVVCNTGFTMEQEYINAKCKATPYGLLFRSY
jgi:SAM-dependent methyltransferase